VYNYSIIIPHKNIPELLERCLASIPVRDDVQIIVIDDNSDPSQVDFEHFPGLGRAHTKVIFTREESGRKGAGYARNVGMEKATGKRLIFADADDMFLPSLSAMMDKYPDSEADIVFLGNSHVDSETMLPMGNTHQMRHIERYLTTGNDDELRYRMFAPWAKFIKRSFIEDHKLRFSEIVFSNDLFFSIKSGHLATTIECDPTPIYAYIRRSSSLCGENNENFDSLSVRFDEDVKVVRFLLSVDQVDSYFNRLILKRWKKLMRIDRRRAMELMPILKEFYPMSRVLSMRLKLAFDPIVAPFRKKHHKI
jgi:glycosyltransferase involved in cell wall biosynthesis